MLTYEPELIDYRLRSYKVDNKHIVRGHLIGTKIGDRGWSVSPETIDENVKQFIGKDFIVSPKKLDPIEHFLVGKTYEDQVEKQKAVTKGKIVNVLGPFSYHDGTNDKYYDFEAEVTDEVVSKALVTGRLPFATSPYIWALDNTGNPIHYDDLDKINKVGVKNWIPVHEALVTAGTFGDISKISKQCLGPVGQCTQALAGSSIEVAEFLSSQIHSEKALNTEMDNNPTDNKPSEVTEVSNVPATKVVETPIVQEQKEEKEETNKVEIDSERLNALEAKEKQFTKLIVKDRTRELENIFTNFPDESTKKEIMKKWVAIEENDLLVEFYNDVLAYSKIAKSKEKNPLVGTSEKKEADFPLAGNSKNNHSRLHRDRSVEEYLGGLIK